MLLRSRLLAKQNRRRELCCISWMSWIEILLKRTRLWEEDHACKLGLEGIVSKRKVSALFRRAVSPKIVRGPRTWWESEAGSVTWEKGQVENQVGLVRERFFTPRLRFTNLDELNAWLLDKSIAYAKVHHHPELTEQTIWEVFEAERPKLVPYAGRFDGFHAVQASVSKTCLVRSDNNKYTRPARARAQRSLHVTRLPVICIKPEMSEHATGERIGNDGQVEQLHLGV
jgi:hypothetical protein